MTNDGNETVQLIDTNKPIFAVKGNQAHTVELSMTLQNAKSRDNIRRISPDDEKQDSSDDENTIEEEVLTNNMSQIANVLRKVNATMNPEGFFLKGIIYIYKFNLYQNHIFISYP